MSTPPRSIGVAFRIWFLTSVCFTIGWGLFSALTEVPISEWPITLLAGLAALIGSTPILVVLFLILPSIRKRATASSDKFSRLLLICAVAILPYAILGGGHLKPSFEKNETVGYVLGILTAEAILLAAAGLAILLSKNILHQYFQHTTNHFIMEPYNNSNYGTAPETQPAMANANNGNKNVIKAFITGGLILLMLIPSIFVSNLVTERETRQQEVTNEISNKWSAPQTLTGPYLAIPYTVHYTDSKGVASTLEKFFFILPENLQVNGSMTPEIRPRSIYKVYLYKSQIKQSGSFLIRLPKNVSLADVRLKDAALCFGIRDFKGIEEAIRVQIKGQSFEMTPGLPTQETETVIESASSETSSEAARTNTGKHQVIESIGLSANIPLTETDLNQTLTFDLPVKINGSQHLHFIPLAGNSEYRINGSWSNPKFDGNNLPGTRVVADSGFNARWTFNKANLPFSTLLEDFTFKKEPLAFGITMVQPADQYAKTNRSVKYAILFIGLTFALFFIIEIMQQKPLHPVQYVLVGLALIIFFTLLLSLSEFMLFDYAYAIAALATILLISLYAKAHFNSVRTALIFSTVLAALYGFIFVLISLEDTALLVGSIGLFIVLALVMYASRKINWYGHAKTTDLNQSTTV